MCVCVRVHVSCVSIVKCLSSGELLMKAESCSTFVPLWLQLLEPDDVENRRRLRFERESTEFTGGNVPAEPEVGAAAAASGCWAEAAPLDRAPPAGSRPAWARRLPASSSSGGSQRAPSSAAPCGRSWTGRGSRRRGAPTHNPGGRRSVDCTGNASWRPPGPRSRGSGPGPARGSAGWRGGGRRV